MAAQYQHASDWVSGAPPYSGVIRADGRWVPCAAGNQDWTDYLTWAETEGNVPDPYLNPAQGGVKIVLQPDEVPVGSMLDSLPPEEGGSPIEELPPKNVDVPQVQPAAANVGDTLTCTMGNWEGEPKLYSSGWVSDAGSEALAYGSEYVVQPSDAGHSITCLVQATNSHGSTTAPPSNAVAIPAAGGAAASSASRAAERSVPRQVEPEREHGHTRRKE